MLRSWQSTAPRACGYSGYMETQGLPMDMSSSGTQRNAAVSPASRAQPADIEKQDPSDGSGDRATATSLRTPGKPPADQGSQLHGRLNSELTSHQVPVGEEITPGLAEIGLGHVSFEQRTLRAFAQRLDADRCHGRVDRFAVTAHRFPRAAERLQRMQHPLTHALPLDDRPVVVAARQQVQGVGERPAQRQVLWQRALGNQPGCPFGYLENVHNHSVAKADRPLIRLQHIDLRATQTPEHRPEITCGPAVIDRGPERPGSMAALDSASPQGEEGEKPLAAFRNFDAAATLRHVEAAEQVHHAVSRRGTAGILVFVIW